MFSSLNHRFLKKSPKTINEEQELNLNIHNKCFHIQPKAEISPSQVTPFNKEKYMEDFKKKLLALPIYQPKGLQQTTTGTSQI